MPRQIEWFQRIEDALAQLHQFPAPVVDRAVMERLLGVSRRNAVRILNQVGGYRVGGSLVVERDELVHWLEEIRRDPQAEHELGRRQQLEQHLEGLRRVESSRRVRIDLAPAAESGLPVGVDLTPGKMEVRFEGAADLLGKLLRVALAVERNWELYRDQMEIR